MDAASLDIPLLRVPVVSARAEAGKRAVVYVRASLDASGEGASVSRQEEACRALVTMRGWSVTEVLADNSISAYGKKERPGWNRVLHLMESGEVDVVVAWHLDRITRNLADLETLISLAEQTGIDIATASGDFDLTTDVGRMVARILAAVARAEVERKAARQKLANAQRAASGKPWSGGARPFGYTHDQLSVVEEEALAIKQAAADALAGMPLMRIARRWEAQGLRSSRASESTKGGWTSRGVKNVLVSPRYAGIRTYRGEEVGQGAWPAILDLETHLELKRRLQDPSRLTHSHSRGSRPANLCSGIALCGACGSTCNGSANRGVFIYRCRNGGHVGPPRDLVDQAVQEEIVGRLLADDALTQLVPQGDSKAEAAQRELAALRERMSVLSDSFAEGVLTKEKWAELSTKLSAKIKEAEQSVVSTVASGVLDGLDVGTGRVVRQWEGLSLDRKRAIISAFLHIEILQAAQGGRTESRGKWNADDHLRITLK